MSKDLGALETLELLKDFVLKNTKNGLDRRLIIGSCDVIKKELKAFEVIKKCINSNGIYRNMIKDRFECGWIGQEEYDLLKEVLE